MGSTQPNAKSAPRLSPARRITFVVAAVVLVPLLLLALLEAGLRLGGFGYPTSYLLSRGEKGNSFLVENDKFGWRFFPRQLARNPGSVRFTADKSPGTYRIFLFGESAALGDPRPAFGMGRYLSVLLQERYPAAKFEVITVAMTAINSHALLPMARECARYDGDFWILYMGNNEMFGPFGANPISGASTPDIRMVRLGLALRATRVGQLVERVASSMFGDTDAAQWEGMKMYRDRQISPADARKEIVYRNFERNLRDIVDLGLSSGAQPILCTVASDIRDFAPLGSMHSKALPGEAKQAWERLIGTGAEHQENLQFSEAAEVYKKAVELSPSYADVHFRLAQVNLETSFSDTNAHSALIRARDLDTLPFRADTSLNRIIRKTAAENAEKLKLVDLELEPWTELPAGAPGSETFFDHVHFTFLGNYRAARALAAQIEELLPQEVTDQRAINWPSAQACERQLALTDWNRRGAVEEMWQRQAEPPFTMQSNHTNRMQALALQIGDLRNVLTTRAAAAARPIYEAAIAGNPNDFHVRKSFAEFLEATRSLKEAADQWIAVSEILPHDALAPYQTGRIYGAMKKDDLALAWLQKALNIRSDFPEAHIEIARVHYSSARYDEALRSCEQALELRAGDTQALVQKAHALGALNRRDEAMDVLREAIRLHPDSWEPRYLLAVELAAADRIAEALVEFQEVTRLRPNYAQARFNLAVAQAKAGKLEEAMAEFRQTLELDPDHKLAREYLSALEQSLSKR